MISPISSVKHREYIRKIVNGNEAFMKNHEEDYFIDHGDSQNPLITLVCCSDSRVHANALLHDPVNTIFVVRNIGNQLQTATGSVEYGIYHLKTPILAFLGHSDCGAIKAVMKGYFNEPPAIYHELDTLPRTLQKSYIDHPREFVKKLYFNIISNINFQVDSAIGKFSNLVENGSLTIIGGYYDFRNDFNQGFGKLILINVNGINDKNEINNYLYDQ
jgi:carbonic anhydrase